MPGNIADALANVLQTQQDMVLTEGENIAGALIAPPSMELIGTVAKLHSARHMPIAEFIEDYERLIGTVETGSIVITDEGVPVAALISSKHLRALWDIRDAAIEKIVPWPDVLSEDYKPQGRKTGGGDPGPTQM